MLLVFLKLLLQRGLNTIRLLLWMLIQKELYAFMFQMIISIIDDKPLNTSCQLVDFPEKPLFSGFSDFCNSRTSTRVLLTDYIAILSPHMLKYIKYVCIVANLSETQISKLCHIILICFHPSLVIPLIHVLQLIQYRLNYPECQLILDNICTV